MKKERYYYIDFIRGIAVLMMIIFHSLYDLNLFELTKIDLSSAFWYWFAKTGVFFFMFCVGASLSISYRRGVDLSTRIRRLIKLAAIAFIISLATWVFIPNEWIYFGAIHCIFTGSTLGLVFVRYRKLAFISMITLTVMFFYGYDFIWASELVNRESIDYIPLHPWFIVILFGILSEPYISKFDLRLNSRVVVWLGKKSLEVYVLHQPIVLGILYLVSKLLK